MSDVKGTVMSPEECSFFLSQYSFGSLISHDLLISHIPFIFSEDNLIETHLASGNPQIESLHNQACLLTVMGPHAFISTEYYKAKPAVPTWNYASVSIRGISRCLTSDELEMSLDRLLARFQPQLKSDKQSFPDDFRQRLMSGIKGVGIEVTQISGILKLGHHRSLADQFGVFKQLEQNGQQGYARFAQQWLRHFRPSILDGGSVVQ
ncbi:FMN-binding negative transcriptional regulator [Prodigiosinella aquatilis]|nr:FMN-binding negative transcriptional regulator [Prodigiosinella sp. LS101]WJV55322.1 FMN-binding negative transcriptional regulator [Prodigiosinella sp. LS101]WJV59685.1 FMN-binding negative transcriptional regulator [Pectobacteriaceae bacterium C111]